MSNYSELLQSNLNDDMQKRLDYMTKLTNKELVASASNPVNNFRNVDAAKKLLRKRGVEGVPQ